VISAAVAMIVTNPPVGTRTFGISANIDSFAHNAKSDVNHMRRSVPGVCYAPSESSFSGFGGAVKRRMGPMRNGFLGSLAAVLTSGVRASAQGAYPQGGYGQGGYSEPYPVQTPVYGPGPAYGPGGYRPGVSMPGNPYAGPAFIPYGPPPG